MIIGSRVRLVPGTNLILDRRHGPYLSLEEARKFGKLKQFAEEHPCAEVIADEQKPEPA